MGIIQFKNTLKKNKNLRNGGANRLEKNKKKVKVGVKSFTLGND